MQIFLLYLFLFLFGSMIGYVIELFFRRFVSAKKWVNPGFMKGPWLPLYGFGVIVMFTMCFLFVGLFPENIHFYNPLGSLFGRNYVSAPTWWDLLPISIMWIGMVLLEFVAGLIFIKGFHVKLWDYTNMKGNIMGIICPVFSLIWLFVAVLFYYGIDPFLFVLSTSVHNYMFGGNGAVAHFGFIFVLGLAYGIMVIDFSTSVNLLTRISKLAKETGVLERYESLRSKWTETIMETKEKFHIDSKKKPEHHSDQLKQKLNKMIYIDPEKEKEKNNYDEKGRPIKEE